MERMREQHKSHHRARADATADESVEHGVDATELERELDYVPVPSDGAAKAAQMVAELL